MGFAAAALVGVAGRAAASGGSGHGARPHAARIYVVHRGDTLWGIATRLSGPAADPRPLVDAIAALNHTRGALVPGQALKVPRVF